MRMSTTRATALVFLLFSVGVLGGAWAGSAAVERARDPYASLDTLVRVLALVESTYVDEIPREELVGSAIRGIVHDLDPHSKWLSPDAYNKLQLRTEGSQGELGVELEMSEDGAKVKRVLPGSPADRDGIQPGDVILAVDGRPLEGASLDEAERTLTGERGHQTRLTLTRPGWDEAREIQTVLDRAEAPSVTTEIIESGLLYTRLRHFHRGVSAELADKVDAVARNQPVDALVLDLRGNPGGLLEEAVATADLFLDEGTIVSTWSRLESERKVYGASPGGLPDDLRLVVLTNGRSASASEIVAAALQDTDRAVIVGTPTYGKGSVQANFEHRDGSALKLTIGRWLTSSGTPVSPREGRAPDVIVPWPSPASPFSRLRKAIESEAIPESERTRLREILDDMPRELIVSVTQIPWDLPMLERLATDPQLRAAVDIARNGQTAAQP